MLRSIPDDKILEIKEKVDIVGVISEYLALNKKGKNYQGLCPFHSERSPSFIVNQEKQIFHCFGCGEGGNIFSFLMKISNVSFPEVVRDLGKRYGISLPSFHEPHKDNLSQKEIFFKINEIALDYYHQNLIRKKDGGISQKYLEKRGIEKETIQEFRLGYALNEWDGLSKHLLSQNIPHEQAEKLGLIVHNPKKKSYFDHFRGRIVFPIFDLNNSVIGFGGRSVDNQPPKYLNSPESLIYSKGKSLYGLNVAKEFIRRKEAVIIVEGYFDLLTLHQAGFRNSVATLGTALTNGHIGVLKRYSSNFFLLFDSDIAGEKASLRSLDLFAEEGLYPRVIFLPHGNDPDSFIRNNSADELLKQMKTSSPLIEFWLEKLYLKYDMDTINGKARYIEEVAPFLSKVKDEVERSLYIKNLSQKLEIGESLILATINKRVVSAPKISSELVGLDSNTKEKFLLNLIFRNPSEIIPPVLEEGILDDFQDTLLQEIGYEAISLYKRLGRLDYAEMVSFIEEPEKARIISEMALDMEIDSSSKTLFSVIKKIRETKLKREKRNLTVEIKRATEREDHEGLLSLLKKKQDLLDKGKRLNLEGN